MLDQIFEQRVRESILVGPLGITENAVQGVRVGLLDFAHGALQGIADVGCHGTNVIPVAVIRDLKAMRLGEEGQFGIAGLIDDLGVFLVPDIADPLEEQEREDVGLEVSRIHRAAQDVGGLPEVAFELTEIDWSFLHQVVLFMLGPAIGSQARAPRS